MIEHSIDADHARRLAEQGRAAVSRAKLARVVRLLDDAPEPARTTSDGGREAEDDPGP